MATGSAAIVPVDDGSLSAEALESRLLHLREVAAATGVGVSLRRLPGRGADVARVLDAAVPLGVGSVIVSGLRARRSRRGLLHGTVSERLLRFTHHDVLAIRVVSPSLLGHARHILFSLSQNPRSSARASSFLKLFAPELTRLSLQTVMSPLLGGLSRPTAQDLRTLRARGREYLRGVEADLRGALAPFEVSLDPHVSVSSDWPGEIIRHAGRTRAELLLLGSTERTLTRRFVFGNPLERVLRDAICDVAIYRASRMTSS
jgi:nucleotide-binding universal stress UspA family protein